MRIVINATPLLARRSGIGRYIARLADNLLHLDTENEYTFFYGYSFGRELRSQPDRTVMAAKAIATRVMKDPWRLREAIHRAVFLTGRLSRGFDLYHEPNYVPLPFRGPLVMTVCDLSLLRYPESHPPQRVAWFKRGFPPAIRRANRFITISHYVKQEMVDRLGVDPARIDVTHLAADDQFRPVEPDGSAPVLQARGLPRQYLLSVGTVEPRKNLATLLRAYAKLPRESRDAYPLVIAGMRGWVGASSHYQDMARLADELGLADRIVFPGYISDEDLPAVYSGATAFVFPSLYEGFGLPPLEAMACGTPVICSNVAALPEVVGDAALTVEPADVDGFAAAIERTVASEALRQDLSRRGMAQANRFSWERCARETLAVYRKTASAA